ncbi:DNA polymerase III subunit gamma and tau [Nocardia neocaledoniensis]|uniref:DNA polymerase III subunit gamma and tau n=1 Tax=Nocardia neocaledoniensis TaxID=236511 RepID=UPI002454655E|nr:DNA polymerase III subunit gamma and tau [Nocardia neocaledoniensis]
MALYRKYRPATFAEVVGQEHVTDPLSTALDTGRISHAYLFSGPRGCGKTSSARILARSLNCVEGPTSTPCGVCPSCVALGPGGAGNLDVIELDAASHGGVDDTRELRDRAFYAPAESRYRVFIVDEAHMVTTAGFNALLKIVEEPPAHLIFIFATTEPDKVLPTIRSRTHHYPFRLLPPATMRGLLGKICEQEHVPVEEAVYPLVIRAGGGSPRDSLSVLDQLLAGAGPDGVTYQRAVSLLGVTDVALIDDAIDALAADDGAALFGTIDSVMEAGHDPRRFAVDLLERLRDLILLRAVPDAADRGLVSGPGDVLERMRDQAERIGPATLTRYAELLHEGLGEMRGATAPRLLLEVICARMLLPSVSDTESATLQRLERLERGFASGAVSSARSAPAAEATSAAAPQAERPAAPAGGTNRRRGAELLAAARAEKEAATGGPVPSEAHRDETATGPAARPPADPGPQIPAERSAPVVDQGVSDPRHTAQPTEPNAPTPQQVTSATESNAPTPHQVTSATEPNAPTPHQVTPATESNAPTPQQATPATESNAPTPQQATPATEPNAPTPQRVTPDPSGVEGQSVAGSGQENAVATAMNGTAAEQVTGATAPRIADPDARSLESETAVQQSNSSQQRPDLGSAQAPDESKAPQRTAAPEQPAAAHRDFAAQASPQSPAPSPEPDAGQVAAPSAEPAAVQSPEPATAAAPAAPAEDLVTLVEGAWAEIKGKVREFGPTLQALLSGAAVSRAEGSTIVFAHQSPPLAQRLSDPRNIDAVRSAVRAVLGRELDVRWETGTPAPRPAPAAKAAGNAARGPGQGEAKPAGRPKFSRPSQTKGNPAGQAKPAGDDDIPPPDFPDLPDDPGPEEGYSSDPGRSGGESARGDAPLAPPTPEEEQEMLAAAAEPVAPGDRQDPDEVALALLRAELGAKSLDG